MRVPLKSIIREVLFPSIPSEIEPLNNEFFTHSSTGSAIQFLGLGQYVWSPARRQSRRPASRQYCLSSGIDGCSGSDSTAGMHNQ